MAKEITIKRKTSSGTEDLHPTTTWGQINSKPSTFTPTAHTHGNINDNGQIGASQTIASGDHLVIADTSASNALTTSSITFGTGTTTFLRNDGTWGTPSGADGNNYLTGVSGSGDGTVTFTRSGLSNLTWDASHSHSEYLPLSGGTMTGTLEFTTSNTPIKLKEDHFIYRKIDATTEAVTGQSQAYILLCRNAGGNDVNGTITMDRTSGLRHASFVDILISAGSSSGPVGTMRSMSTAGNSNPTYKLVTLTYSSNSYVALSIYNPDTYYDTSGMYFTGRIKTTDTSNEFLMLPASSVTSVSDFGTNESHQINGDKIWHAGNDGSGSGLDADTLDGSHASTFAPLASPALTGIPTAPTTATSDNSTKIATTAYVKSNISNLIGGAPAALDTLNELAAALADDENYASTITTALATKVNKSGDTMTGNLTFSNDTTGVEFYGDNALKKVSGTGLVMTTDSTRGLDILLQFERGSGGTKYKAFHDGYHPNADKWTTARTLSLTGDVTGSVSWDGSANASITTTVADDSHNHTIANVDGLQTALDGKASSGHTHSNLVSVSGDTMTGDLTMQKDGTTNVGSHGIVFQANTSLGSVGDFTRELNIDSAGNLVYNGNTIFHEGNDGSASGLHADLLDGQQGSYYLNYNNLSNTPTLITNNNQLTNGAGYTTNTGTVTNVTVGTGLDVSNGTTTPSISLDLSEFTDMTADVVGSQDELILLDSGAERRKLISEIKLSQFNNDAGFITSDTTLSIEQVQDIVGGMVSGNSESGISVTYQDTDGTLDFNVSDPTITLTGAVTGSGTMTNLGNVSIATTATADPTLTLSGDASGSATFTNLGNATLNVTVANDSHTHDGRYYTETETNNLLAGKLATTAAAAAVTYTTSCPTANNSTGMKVYVGSTDCSTKYTGWLYIVT